MCCDVIIRRLWLTRLTQAGILEPRFRLGGVQEAQQVEEPVAEAVAA